MSLITLKSLFLFGILFIICPDHSKSPKVTSLPLNIWPATSCTDNRKLARLRSLSDSMESENAYLSALIPTILLYDAILIYPRQKGLYRIPGSDVKVKKFKKDFICEGKLKEGLEINTVATTTKHMINKLMPHKAKINALNNFKEKLNEKINPTSEIFASALYYLTRGMTQTEIAASVELLSHYKAMLKYGSETKMISGNLATVVVPSFMNGFNDTQQLLDMTLIMNAAFTKFFDSDKSTFLLFMNWDNEYLGLIKSDTDEEKFVQTIKNLESFTKIFLQKSDEVAVMSQEQQS